MNQSPAQSSIRPLTGFSAPMYIMAKAVGAACNLDCSYCYYTEKAHMHRQGKMMDDSLLETFVKNYIGSQSTPDVLFTWHGGEPLLRGLPFYRKAVALQHYHAAGRHIDNCIQTNGTLLNDDWCRFFKENNWLVGISIDGPERFHDAFRRDHSGRGSFRDVMSGIELLKKHGVEWNAMSVVNSLNADFPEEFYDFFKSIGCRFLQFAPIVERTRIHDDGRHLAAPDDHMNLQLTKESVSPDQWGAFLCALFDRWVRADVGEVFVQLFDATLANWAGEAPGTCILSPECGQAAAMESNGDLYPCDHFVFPQYRLGNIRENTLMEMMYGPVQQKFGQAKSSSLPGKCRNCRWLSLCHGECPKNRFVHTPQGEPGLNYLCEGYSRFFAHTAPYMRFMRDELAAGRAPANIMDVLKNINLNSI